MMVDNNNNENESSQTYIAPYFVLENATSNV